MDSKPLFEAEHNGICAFPDMPILAFYEGYFDCVYIILHPFYKEDNSTDLITWKEFIELAGFKDRIQLDLALRNLIRGLSAKWENEEDVVILKQTCKEHHLHIPSEGEFQEALTTSILKSLQDEGHHYLYISDELGFERKVAYIQDVIDDPNNAEFQIGGHDSWYTIKNEILYTVHWDSYFTLLCSDRATVERILAKHPYEGFYCDETTEIYWCCKS
jgi:hypothetical protein